MENITVILIPVLMGAALLRILMLPMKLFLRLGLHAVAGFLCLWLLNSISQFTGILFPLNWITVLVSGIFGIPGIAFLALMALI